MSPVRWVYKDVVRSAWLQWFRVVQRARRLADNKAQLRSRLRSILLYNIFIVVAVLIVMLLTAMDSVKNAEYSADKAYSLLATCFNGGRMMDEPLRVAYVCKEVAEFTY